MAKPHPLVVLYQLFALLSSGWASYFNNFTLPEDYNNEVPPTGEGTVPFPIKLKAEIVHIVNIREFDFVLSLDLVVRRFWTESRVTVGQRLARGRRYLINKTLAAKFWKPQIYTRNVQAYTLAHGSQETSYLVMMADNRMIMIDRAYMDIRCGFDFQLFPMDIQTCMVEFVLPMSRVDEETLEWDDKEKGAAFYLRPAGEWYRLPKFKVQVVACKDNFTSAHLAGNVSSLRFWVVLHRELGNYLLEIYIPTSLFVIVSWGSFLVNPDVVPGRMVLLVTNLLSLITLFESTRSTTPPCIGVKSMDVWVLACISFVVMALIEYCVILYAIKQQGNTYTHCKLFTASDRTKAQTEINREFKKLQRNFTKRNIKATVRQYMWMISTKCFMKKGSWFSLDRLSLVVFPISFIIFSIAYWTTMTLKQKNDIYCP